GAPPHHLCVQRPGIYRDEEGRSWVTVRERSIRVHLWQIPVHPQGTLFFSQLPFSQLPLTWQLCPGKKYQGSDSRTWQIVDHDQTQGENQESLLHLLPRVEVGKQPWGPP
uniref:TCL1 family AKT coactivator B n=1 Tax=Urocitellus parryii TaxID=9999 RepID=A0A8D2H0L7_UROPR